MANNDLPDVIHSHTRSYKEPTGHFVDDGDKIHLVDDSIVILSSSNPAIISEKLSSDCRDIADYMAANKFVINADKTHLMAMAPSRLAGHRHQVQIVAGDFTIRPSES